MFANKGDRMIILHANVYITYIDMLKKNIAKLMIFLKKVLCVVGRTYVVTTLAHPKRQLYHSTTYHSVSHLPREGNF